jgi:signal transduction histidine kinase
VQQAVRMLATLAVEKSIRIKVVSKSEPESVLLDRRLLGQILNNVIGNAIKFTDRGSVIITIDAINDFNEESGERAQYVSVEVKDTGIGIEESFLPYIFDEFKQQSSGNNRRYEGAGIGLNIAKRMLALLGARVEVQSKVGVGTTFLMKFPVNPPN